MWNGWTGRCCAEETSGQRTWRLPSESNGQLLQLPLQVDKVFQNHNCDLDLLDLKEDAILNTLPRLCVEEEEEQFSESSQVQPSSQLVGQETGEEQGMLSSKESFKEAKEKENQEPKKGNEISHKPVQFNVTLGKGKQGQRLIVKRQGEVVEVDEEVSRSNATSYTKEKAPELKPSIDSVKIKRVVRHSVGQERVAVGKQKVVKKRLLEKQEVVGNKKVVEKEIPVVRAKMMEKEEVVEKRKVVGGDEQQVKCDVKISTRQCEKVSVVERLSRQMKECKIKENENKAPPSYSFPKPGKSASPDRVPPRREPELSLSDRMMRAYLPASEWDFVPFVPPKDMKPLPPCCKKDYPCCRTSGFPKNRDVSIRTNFKVPPPPNGIIPPPNSFL